MKLEHKDKSITPAFQLAAPSREVEANEATFGMDMDQLASPFDLNARPRFEIDGADEILRNSRPTITYNFITENNNFGSSAFPSYKTDAVTQTEPDNQNEGFCISCKEEFPWWRSEKHAHVLAPHEPEPVGEEESEEETPEQAYARSQREIFSVHRIDPVTLQVKRLKATIGVRRAAKARPPKVPEQRVCT